MSDDIQAWPLKIEQRASILDLICAYCLGSAFFSANKPIAQMTSPIPECVETFSRSTRFGRSCLWQTDTSGAGSMSAPKLVASIRPDHVTCDVTKSTRFRSEEGWGIFSQHQCDRQRRHWCLGCLTRATMAAVKITSHPPMCRHQRTASDVRENTEGSNLRCTSLSLSLVALLRTKHTVT